MKKLLSKQNRGAEKGKLGKRVAKCENSQPNFRNFATEFFFFFRYNFFLLFLFFSETIFFNNIYIYKQKKKISFFYKRQNATVLLVLSFLCKTSAVHCYSRVAKLFWSAKNEK